MKSFTRITHTTAFKSTSITRSIIMANIGQLKNARRSATIINTCQSRQFSLKYTSSSINHDSPAHAVTQSSSFPASSMETPTHLFASLDPISWIKSVYIGIHDMGAIHDLADGSLVVEYIPWWAAVVLGTVGFRLACTLPLAIIQRKRIKRLQEVQGLVKAWEATAKNQQTFDTTGMTEQEKLEVYNKKHKEKVRQLYRVHKCHPLQTFLLPWTQIPLFVSISLTLRQMVAYPFLFLETPPAPLPGLSEGGFLWFLDLTAPDPTVLLPLLVGGLHLANIEMNMSAIKKPSVLERLLKALFQFLAIMIVPVAAQVPSVLALYWTTSAAFSLVQNAMLRRLKL